MVGQVADLIKKLTDSPKGREAVAEMEAEMEVERLTKRLGLVDEIKALRGDVAAKTLETQKTVKVAQTKVEKAWEAYLAAQQGFAKARIALSNNSADRRIDVLEGELRNSADRESTRAFVDEMDKLHGEVRHGAYTRQPTMTKSIDGKFYPTESGNAAEVSDCLGRIVDARREAGTLALEPLDAAGLKARLDELRAGIKIPKRYPK